MPDFVTVAATGTRSLSAGQAVGASLNRRGEQILMPWHVQLAMEGKLFVASLGTTTTPISSNIPTAIDITLPEITIQAPTGITIVPISALVYYEATGAAIAECALLFSDNAPGNGTSSALTAGPSNMRPRGPASACTGRQVVTVTPTYTNQVEFWRSGEPADLDSAVGGNGQAGLRWNYLQNGDVPILVGPASLNLCIACGTSSSVFGKLIWAEFNTADLGLS